MVPDLVQLRILVWDPQRRSHMACQSLGLLHSEKKRREVHPNDAIVLGGRKERIISCTSSGKFWN